MLALGSWFVVRSTLRLEVQVEAATKSVPRCKSHFDRSSWVDQEAGDQVKTVCSICGSLIGYRWKTEKNKSKKLEHGDGDIAVQE